MDPKQDMMEAAYFKKCVAQIKGYYKDKLREDVLKDYEPFSRTYIDRWGFVQTDWVYPDTRNAEYEVDRKVKKVLKEPYFCHIDYKDDCELYIGRQAIHGWVTDWADKRASLYHQYEMYIGDKKTGLNFVRDIHIVNSAYKGYEDKYNRGGGQKKEILKFTDTHLAKIIAANQQNKRIHDIVESIQQNQYNVSAKCSCGFSNTLISSIIAGERYLDYISLQLRRRGYGNYSQSSCSDDGTDQAYQ